AQAMTTIGPMRDVAQHDLARILWIAERQEEAITAQRFAARAAPAERRSFHLWTLACFLFHAGAHEPALSALDRGLRWARRDRPLLMAQAALIRLEQDEPVEELERVLRELRESPHGRGYGQYLLGMIALYLGDDSKAVVYLRAFLTRHASADVPTQLTLRDELGAARAALARLDSD
ncbi:MAG: hypothetical protein OEY14_16625, partial [Myxococcales bacterium]|nr:hypothetical protein [Myxococcales bacterium]